MESSVASIWLGLTCFAGFERKWGSIAEAAADVAPSLRSSCNCFPCRRAERPHRTAASSPHNLKNSPGSLRIASATLPTAGPSVPTYPETKLTNSSFNSFSSSKTEHMFYIRLEMKVMYTEVQNKGPLLLNIYQRRKKNTETCLYEAKACKKEHFMKKLFHFRAPERTLSKISGINLFCF